MTVISSPPAELALWGVIVFVVRPSRYRKAPASIAEPLSLRIVTSLKPTSPAGVSHWICVSLNVETLVAGVAPRRMTLVPAPTAVKPEPFKVNVVPPIRGPSIGEIEPSMGAGAS